MELLRYHVKAFVSKLTQITQVNQDEREKTERVKLTRLISGDMKEKLNLPFQQTANAQLKSIKAILILVEFS